MLRAQDAISTQPLAFHRAGLTCRHLASSRWLTPVDRSTWMYSRCRSVRLGCRPEKGPPARTLA